jgi:hypothetical protein
LRSSIAKASIKIIEYGHGKKPSPFWIKYASKNRRECEYRTKTDYFPLMKGVRGMEHCFYVLLLMEPALLFHPPYPLVGGKLCFPITVVYIAMIIMTKHCIDTADKLSYISYLYGN